MVPASFPTGPRRDAATQSFPPPVSDSTRGQMARFPDMNPGPVACLDRSGSILMANRAARKLLKEQALEGKCFWDLVPGIDEESRRGALEGKTVRIDLPVQDVWLNLTITPDPASNDIFVYGTDITLQKAAEREAYERARFPELNPGPVARLRRDGTVLRANPAAGAVFGHQDLSGFAWLELCPGLDAVVWARVFEGGSSITHEEQIGDRWYSFTLRHESELDQVFVYGTDVTEMKAAERALAELARFPEFNPGPVVRLDRQGTVLLANPAALRVFGGSDLAGRSWLDVCPGVAGDFWSEVLKAQAPTPLEVEIDRRHYVMTHAPGSEGLFVFVYGSDITLQKQSEAALRQSEKMATLGTLSAGLAHEMNNPASAAQRAAAALQTTFDRLQKVEWELRAAAASDKLDEVQAELLQEAHEGRHGALALDPLTRADVEDQLEAWLAGNGVEEPWDIAASLTEVGYDPDRIEALTQRVGEGAAGLTATWLALVGRAQRLLDEVRHSASRLSELVGAMKAYSYLGQGPVQTVDVNEGLRSTLIILGSKLREGVTVVQDLDPDLPKIQGFGSELSQVWTNLIDNAVEAMEASGTLRLRTSVRRGDVVVEVEDDGPGIPPTIQHRIYDAFFTTKPPGSGTGLGLYTTYNIVTDKHGGSIELDSIPGRTLFTVRLPTEQRSRPEQGVRG